MNKYEVVSTVGWNHYVLNVVDAIDEYHARKIVWEKKLSEGQRNNCEDMEVFPASENIKNIKYHER
jgi:hypothetical protein